MVRTKNPLGRLVQTSISPGARKTGISKNHKRFPLHGLNFNRINPILSHLSFHKSFLYQALKISVVVLALAVLLPGCGTRLTKKGMPFELDKVFRGLFFVETETARDKGLRLVRERDYNGAIEAFKIAVIESPEDFFGFNAMAVCYKNLGDNAKAMLNYERAFELARSPEERAKVLSNIGNLYGVAKKHQVALGFYKEAQNESPQNPMYLILIARTFIYLDELPRAQKVVRAAEDIIADLPKHERDEDRGLGHYLMAQVYLALDDEENLFKALEKSVKANPQKFLKRLALDASDETNLFFTIRDEPRLKKLLKNPTG